jgi:molybdate transport system ATP-binding protein
VDRRAAVVVVMLNADVGVRVGTLDLAVALEVAAGERVAVLGPNGAGKSTLLRAIAGLLPLDSGSIAIDDSVVDLPPALFVEAEHRNVGVVFQQYLLFHHMTVLENVAFGMRARGTHKSEARRTAADWLERLGLSAYAQDRPSALSGGQSQRVALARALAGSPSVLLLDEPLAALDAGTRDIVRRDLRAHLAAFSGATVLVTHDPVDAFALAQRVVVVEQGRVVQAGTLAEVAAHPRSRYVADLVGVNLIAGEVRAGVLITTMGARVVIADATDGPSLAVIRPHSVVVARSDGAVPGTTSARNVWHLTVVDIDRMDSAGARVRLRLDGELALAAEITVGALDALSLAVGDRVEASVKATDIDVFPG